MASRVVATSRLCVCTVATVNLLCRRPGRPAVFLPVSRPLTEIHSRAVVRPGCVLLGGIAPDVQLAVGPSAPRGMTIWSCAMRHRRSANWCAASCPRQDITKDIMSGVRLLNPSPSKRVERGQNSMSLFFHCFFFQHLQERRSPANRGTGRAGGGRDYGSPGREHRLSIATGTTERRGRGREHRAASGDRRGRGCERRAASGDRRGRGRGRGRRGRRGRGRERPQRSRLGAV
jgi:hypothetical protein